MKFSASELPLLEELAEGKYPRKGKCGNSCFANGHHRVGNIELESVLDGGAPGNSGKPVCLQCGKIFNDGFFMLRKQPRKIGELLK